MIINKNSIIRCENRNAELLLDGIFSMLPDITFTVIGDVVTEHEALALYNALEAHKSLSNGQKMIYVPVFRVA